MTKSKIETEKKMVEFMIRLYCRHNHHGAMDGKLCLECHELLEYAHRRLGKCRFGDNKPSCSRCSIHCYSPAKREQIRMVMRYSGPRMIWHHPILALRHMWDFLVSRMR